MYIEIYQKKKCIKTVVLKSVFYFFTGVCAIKSCLKNTGYENLNKLSPLSNKLKMIILLDESTQFHPNRGLT